MIEDSYRRKKEFATLYYKITSFLGCDRTYDSILVKVHSSSRHRSGRMFCPGGEVLDDILLRCYTPLFNSNRNTARGFISDAVGRPIEGTHPELTIDEIRDLYKAIVDPNYKPKPINTLILGGHFIGLCGGCVVRVKSNSEDDVDVDLLIKNLNKYMIHEKKCVALIVCGCDKVYLPLKSLVEDVDGYNKNKNLTEVFETKSFIYTKL